MNTIELNNGVVMPQLGYGVYQIPAEQTAEAVYQAIKAGYRLIDTAAVYGNEKKQGKELRERLKKALLQEKSYLSLLNYLSYKHLKTVQKKL